MTNENNQAENMPQEAAPQPAPVYFRRTGDMPKLWAALAKAQAEFQPIKRTKTVHVQPREGRAYDFDYAPLEVVLDATRPALNANGIGVLFPICSHTQDGWLEIRTMLVHESGAELECIVCVKEPDKIQAMGSLKTYWTRYSYSSLVGVSSEDDDDGNQADGNQREVTRDRSKPPPARPAAAQPAPAQKPAEQPKPPVKAEASPGVYVAPQKIQEATVLEITTLARSLGFNKPQMAEFCMKVLGKVWDKADPSTEPTEEEGLKLLGQLREAKASVA